MRALSWPRRAALAGILTTAVLSGTACGHGTQPPGDGKPGPARSGSAVSNTGDQNTRFGTDAKPGQFPRTIRHAMGETTLRKRPARVVVLDAGELDDVVSLGVAPVAVADTEGFPAVPAYLVGTAGEPVSLGAIDNINLETVAALTPDLILGTRLHAETLYPKLAAIAPTVFSLRPDVTWKENFRLNAAVLDRVAEADRLLREYEIRAADLGNQVDAKFTTRPTVSVVRFTPDAIRLYADRSFIGTILADAGLPRPRAQHVDDLAVAVTAEQMTKADADWILISDRGDPARTTRAEVLAGPLWAQLPGVRAGHTRVVDDETWYHGLGVLAAGRVLDDLRQFLAA